MAESLRADPISVPHGFFTRRGGVSTGRFASLNCSLSSPDAREAVLENRARAAHALGADPALLMGVTQVHGHDVVTVTEPWAAGEGARADAMVTNRSGFALGIITADCAPVLLSDPDAGVSADLGVLGVAFADPRARYCDADGRRRWGSGITRRRACVHVRKSRAEPAAARSGAACASGEATVVCGGDFEVAQLRKK